MFNSLGIGRAVIAVGGSAVALTPASTPARRVDIQALKSNSAEVFIGDRSVQNSSTAGGISLSPGEIYNIELISDLINIYVNGSISEGVSFIWWIGDRN